MIVTGLESDLYYINNPILINIKELDPELNYVDLVLFNINDVLNRISSNTLRIYSNLNNEIIDFDLSEAIKANFPRPEHPLGTLGNGSEINTNYVRFRMTFQELRVIGTAGDIVGINKTFLRGGEDTQGLNVTTNVGAVLKEGSKILIWGGLPVSKYYIDENKKISITNFIPEIEIQQIKTVGCDPFYVRFLNSKGGYSFWLFPVWEKEKKTKSAGFIERQRPLNSFSLGFESTHTVKAESKIRREHFEIAESLITSQEIHVYDRYGNTWAKIEIKDGGFSRNTYEDITDFNVSFNANLSNDERLIW